MIRLSRPALAVRSHDPRGLMVACLTGAALTLGVVQAKADPALEFTVMGGAQVQPDYFGAPSSSLGPTGAFGLGYVAFRGMELGEAGRGHLPVGTGLGGAFRFIDKRNAALAPELAGLDPIGRSVELGLRLQHTEPGWQIFGEARYGVVGHHSFVGELGANLILRPTDALTLSAGPRLSLGSRRFNDTYFGVSADESAASGGAFAAYAPTAGVVGTGLEIGAHYAFTPDWAVVGEVRYDRLSGEASQSPIVQQGSRDQFIFTLGIERRFQLRF